MQICRKKTSYRLPQNNDEIDALSKEKIVKSKPFTQLVPKVTDKGESIVIK